MNQPEPPDPSANVYSRQLEVAVLGVLLDGRHQALWSTFVDTCKGPLVFFVHHHRVIALAISLLADDGSKIDAQTVTVKLGQMPWDATRQALKAMELGKSYPPSPGPDVSDSALAAVGANGVLDLLAGAGFVSGFAENCRLLTAYKVQRDMGEALADALDHARASDGSKKLAAIADKTINRLATLVMAQEGTALMSEAMRKAITVPSPGPAAATSRRAIWGMNALDRACPLDPGQLVTLAAKPGAGKTSLALQAVAATAEALGTGAVAIKSLEMSAAQVGAIMLARILKTTARAITTGMFSPEKRAIAEAEIARRVMADIYFDAPDEHSPIDKVCAWIRRCHSRSQGRLTLVVIDYLQLIDGHGHQSEYDRVSEASRRMKKIALALNITVLALSQMSREGTKSERDTSGRVKGNPEPRLTDLRGSGSIEQDSDGVVFIWPPIDVTVGDLPVIFKIAKQRHVGESRFDAVFERTNGQVFREMNSSRAHHAHEPRASEDAYATAGEQTDPQQQEPG